MIVNLTNNGWEIIYHRAHALLAAKIGGEWNKDNLPTTRFYETIAAISHHDDLEQEWEDAQLTDAGAPLDFMLDTKSSIEQLEKLVESALHRSQWVAMLVSMHICCLNQSHYGTSEEWDRFLNEQVKNQEKWRKILKISKDEADRTYQFMHWCDRMSLILCQKKLPADERALEITSRLDNQRYDIKQFNDGTVTVEPWPFEKDRFELHLEVTYLSQLKFEDDADLQAALREAPIREISWEFAKRS